MTHQMALDSLNPTDKKIVDMLAEGRCTPSYLAKETDTTRQNVQRRLEVLTAGDVVKKVDTGLYELIHDPREGGDE